MEDNPVFQYESLKLRDRLNNTPVFIELDISLWIIDKIYLEEQVNLR